MLVSMTRYCDQDRSLYTYRGGYVDFRPQSGVIVIERFGEGVKTVLGSPQYVRHIRDRARAELGLGR